VNTIKNQLAIVYSDLYLDWLLGPGDGSHPTNPIRAKNALTLLVKALGSKAVIVDPVDEAKEASDMKALEATHDSAFIKSVLAGVCGQWSGTKPIMGQTAYVMFKGTIRAVELILAGAAKVVFNPQGAKHHAKYSSASGFCVFNDMAYAAMALKAAGLKVLYLDWDIHAGDGVAEMLEGSGIPRISIHNGSIFPSGYKFQTTFGAIHDEADLCYNFCVRSGDGDEVFMDAIDRAKEIIDAYKPDVILLAAGADGHTGPNSIGVDNNYTAKGFKYAAEMVAEMAIKHSEGRVLIGGAGGYQPEKETPETWALVVETIYNEVSAAFGSEESDQRNAA
jgi:acetoin utilization protein AcuC